VKTGICRKERLSRLDNALQAFQHRYKVAPKRLATLRVQLTRVPEEVEMREKNLLAGLSARPSEFPVPPANVLILSAIKEIGLYKRMSLQHRDALKKRLSRHNSTIPRSEGRQKYPYADLEKDFASAIVQAVQTSETKRRLKDRPNQTRGQQRYLSRDFPVSRYGGTTLKLLLAALAYALPYTGEPKPQGVVKRLSAFPDPSLKSRTVRST
jgi:hypothetical protein